MQCSAFYKSPLGTIILTVQSDALVGLVFSNSAEDGSTPENPVLQNTIRWLDAYFAGKKPDPSKIPVLLQGTPFQQQVWEILRQIPYGHWITYGQIARQISPRMSSRAVGRAVGSNPISILIPCHRVLGVNRKRTGYAFGLERKQALLDLEGIFYC